MLPCAGKQPLVKEYGRYWTELPAGVLRRWLAWSTRPGGPDAWARLGESVVVSSSVPDRPAPRIVVLDIETRDPAVVEPLRDMYGWSPLVVQTRRGAHVYFREPAGVEIKTAVFKALSHDVKGRRALCHLPGSVHAGGGRYQAFFDGAPLDSAALLAEPEGCLLDVLPTFEVAALQSVAEECGFHHAAWRRCDGATHLLADDEARERGGAYLAAAGPAVGGSGGHDKTRGVLLRLGDLGVPEHVALELALEWDECNLPAWGEEEIQRAVADAYRSRKSVVGWEANDAGEDDDLSIDSIEAAIAALRD